MSVEDIFTAKKRNENIPFLIILAVLLALLFAAVSYLSTIEALPAPVQEKLATIRTTFTLVQEPHPKPPAPVREPIDLGERPRVARTVEELPRETAQTPPSAEQPQEARRVFGLQRVYSTGLGSGGSMSSAVVGRFGNTIEGTPDTITATRGDLLGEVVSTANITQAPSFRTRVRPVITDEIRASGVSGTIRVRTLVDIDGKVKQATTQDDLGFGTRESALEAVLQMEFIPAMRGDEAVAVWITIPVRFERL